MPSATAAHAQAAALPEDKQFIRGWIIPNVGMIDYGQSFATKGDGQALWDFFEPRWKSYRDLAEKANNEGFNSGNVNPGIMIGIADAAYEIAHDLQGMSKKFPDVFRKPPPVRSMKTREGLLYNYWRRPVEELYNKTAAAAHIFGDLHISARGLKILTTDLETDGLNPKTKTENGFDFSLKSYFRAYVEIIDTLRAAGANEQFVGDVYVAYGNLMHEFATLIQEKYPEMKTKFRDYLASLVAEEYSPTGSPVRDGFYSKLRANPGKTALIGRIHGMVKALDGKAEFAEKPKDPEI